MHYSAAACEKGAEENADYRCTRTKSRKRGKIKGGCVNYYG